jgi:RsiW-degrading membrane proteinase PrsW (M82 family)
MLATFQRFELELSCKELVLNGVLVGAIVGAGFAVQ